MTMRKQAARFSLPSRQRGMVLLVSLVFLLLLTMLGISSMQSATQQEKMAGSVSARNKSFQTAEAALRAGESSIKVKGFVMPKCTTPAQCAPPAESTTMTAAGTGSSGVLWVGSVANGFYGIQNLGTTATPIVRPANCSGSVTLYRVTSVAIQDTTQNALRTVLESIYGSC